MYCAHCGTELAPAAKFCHACGSASFSPSSAALGPAEGPSQTTPLTTSSKPKASRRSQWSLKVTTEQEARKAIRESALGFYFVAGLQALLGGLVLGPSALIDAALFAGLGFWLHKTSSKVAATILAVLAAVSIGTTFWNQATGAMGGRNVVLSLIVFWVAVRALIATYKLPDLVQREPGVGTAG